MGKDPLELFKAVYYDKVFALDAKHLGAAPSIVYHYTNTASFMSIIQNKTLWASRAEFLNDAQEFRYGQNICKREIENCFQRMKNIKDSEPSYSRQ
jgi:hypothetical protein